MKRTHLTGKHIIFLGSSVTYGWASEGVAFADLLGEKDGIIYVKEAVSGTTLVDESDDSYIARMKLMEPGFKPDLFVCQLSTNDATLGKCFGKVQSELAMDEYDTTTIAGAIQYIIAYAKEKYQCPVAFYTSPRYESEPYEKMVELLCESAKKEKILIIDQWEDETFNQISDEKRALYMADSIHPTYAGYEEWWLPFWEKELEKIFQAI